jgi:ribonuclease P protein component
VIATPPSDPSGARFPRSARVRARAAYARVFEGGRRLATPQLTLHWLRDGEPPRLGLAVSRKVDPDAVGRNRIKRSLREQFRRIRSDLGAGAYVLVARPPAAQATNHELRVGLLALLQRAGALPPPDAPGTMPASAPDQPCSDRPSPIPMPRPRAG